MLWALHRRCTRVLARSDPPLGGELVGDEAVAERRIVCVDLSGGVDQVCVVPLPCGDRVVAPVRVQKYDSHLSASS